MTADTFGVAALDVHPAVAVALDTAILTGNPGLEPIANGLDSISCAGPFTETSLTPVARAALSTECVGHTTIDAVRATGNKGVAVTIVICGSAASSGVVVVGTGTILSLKPCRTAVGAGGVTSMRLTATVFITT